MKKTARGQSLLATDNVVPLTVGIGASAGGLEAFRSFFAAMPADSGMAFVLIQHLAPAHKSMLAELIAKSTDMPVIEAADDIPVKPNSVFVIPPDATMTIKGGRLRLDRPAPPREIRRPIDSFLQSLAEDRGERAIGIILSGTGSDGTLGLVAIKEQGGLTLAQAEFDHEAMAGMPQSAAATGQVDTVLAVEEMPKRLLAHQKHLRTVATAKDEDGTRTDAASHLAKILTALRARTGHDFSAYKEKTLVRRLQRRMQVLQIANPPDYIKYYRDHPEELDLLFREFLIGVTQFFRDPAAFDAVESTVLKKIVSSRGADDEIRIWVPGCATGQEVYSIAILVREAINERRMRPGPRVQIFATDIDERAIADARLGRYRIPVGGLSADRLERWFNCEGKYCTVVPEIREMCVFSLHSLVKDPPFSRLDLISCRNLLIYLDQRLQDQVIRTFHYALKPGGYLFLGSSESVTRATKLFSVEEKKHRVFKRKEIEQRSLPDLISSRRAPPTMPLERSTQAVDRIEKGARRAMEKHYPPHIVIDQHHQIVRFSGGTMGQYLEPAPGVPSFALFDILRKPLRPAVRAILSDAHVSNGPIVHANVVIRGRGGGRLITLIAEPLTERNASLGYTVLAFQDGGAVVDKGEPRDKKSNDILRALEQELLTTRSQLQSTIDEFESANEEMKSSNEEYQSVNEELQSANEELETSKEEMQSINEELQTVNSEIISKNEVLMRLNSDIANLLESTEIATMFLDEHLRIKSFTRGMTDIFHVRDTDIGRPITEIVSVLDYATLNQDVQKVLRTLTPVERQVTLINKSMTFSLRIRPYRTVDNVIDGTVMTFVDVTERDAAERARRETDAYLRLLVDSAADAIYCIDGDGATTMCNEAFARLFGFENVDEPIGKKLHGLIHHSHADGTKYPQSECPIYRTARSGEPVHCTNELFFRVDGEAIPVEYWARPIVQGDKLRGAVCTLTDIRERLRHEEQQQLLLNELDHRVKNLFAVVGGVITLSARSATTTNELVKTIQGRLGALAGAHQLIRAGKPGDMSKRKSTLEQLVRTILLPHLPSSADTNRAKIEGPEVIISGEAVTSIALFVHELATNAVKYGALSVPDGQVLITWALEDGYLRLVWRERGGPPARAPVKEGFGSLLVQRSVKGQLGGTVDFQWHNSGLVVQLSVPEARLAR